MLSQQQRKFSDFDMELPPLEVQNWSLFFAFRCKTDLPFQLFYGPHLQFLPEGDTETPDENDLFPSTPLVCTMYFLYLLYVPLKKQTCLHFTIRMKSSWSTPTLDWRRSLVMWSSTSSWRLWRRSCSGRTFPGWTPDGWTPGLPCSTRQTRRRSLPWTCGTSSKAIKWSPLAAFLSGCRITITWGKDIVLHYQGMKWRLL